MPKPVSMKQLRLMHAVMEGKAQHARGVPPKSVASKYTQGGKGSAKNLPEQSGENRGGTWGSAAHGKAKEKVQEERTTRKKKRAKKKANAKDLKKSFEEFYKGRGAGTVVINKQGKILIGKQANGRWSTPGGHLDGTEDFDEAALRELREETGLVGCKPRLIGKGKFEGNESQTFVVCDYKGRLKGDGELKQLKFADVTEIPWNKMRRCSLMGIKDYLSEKLKKHKSLKAMVAIEELQKNIIRQKGDAVFEITHGDSMRLVGNGVFRFLRNSVIGMEDEAFKDIKLGDHTLHMRKHMNDVYSGRVYSGHKMVHQFTNKSLPAITAELMSVFEWYLPEDQAELEILDESKLSDAAIEGGMGALIDNYKKHNLANIYDEMNNIREEIRNNNTVDLYEVEKRMMKLFDHLEQHVIKVVDRHNELSHMAGQDIDQLEEKLKELQQRIDGLHHSPTTVEAYSAHPVNPDTYLDDHYCYLPKPSIVILPNGCIKISFSQDWSLMDRENLLRDMKAKAIKKSK